MSNPNFSSVLDKQADTIERPKPYPVGTYTFLVQGPPKLDKTTKKQTDFCEFTCKFLAPSEDVDREALAEMGGISDKTIRNTYYLTEDAVWRLKEFLTTSLGIDGSNKSLREMLSEAPGRQFLGHIRHKPSEDGTTVFAEIDSTAAV